MMKEEEKEIYKEKSTSTESDIPALDLRKTAQGDIPLGWSNDVVKEKTDFYNFFLKFFKIGRWVFWALIAIALMALGVGVFYLYQYSATKNVSLLLNAPAEVLVGVPFDINIDFKNSSGKPIQGVKLSLFLPEEALSTQYQAKRVLNQDFGDLAAGSDFQTKINVVVFGKSDSIRRFQATVSYAPSSLGLSTRFEKSDHIDVAVRDPGIKLDLIAPQKVLNDEKIDIKINYKNTSDIKFPTAKIELALPSSFNLKEAKPQPRERGSTWEINNLDKGGEGVIDVSGSIVAAEQSFFEIQATVKIGDNLVDQKSVTINIAPSPLSLVITLNGQINYITHTNDNLKYLINYQNSSDVGLTDVVIKTKLTSEMFNYQTINTNGFYSSVDNTVTWNAANTPDLRTLAPAAGGTVEFDISTKQNYPIRRLADKNFVLKIDAEISSPTVPYYVAADKTVAISHFETKVQGNTVLSTKVFFNDQASGIKNSGHIPPKVNTPTTFTVHWIITNYSTDIRNIQVKSSLLAGVRFTGKVESNIDAVPTYNERTGDIAWTIDRIPATKGILNHPFEAVFQVEAIPAITQVGQPMPLTADTTLTAIDDFTSVNLGDAAPALTTKIADDLTPNQSEGIVVQ